MCTVYLEIPSSLPSARHKYTHNCPGQTEYRKLLVYKKSHTNFYFSEPKTEILGAPELFINRGSTINLTCVVLQSPEPPAYIFWNHNDAVSLILFSIILISMAVALPREPTFRKHPQLKRTKFTRNE